MNCHMHLFRPIAIAPLKGPAEMDIYAESTPRRAKRLRSASGAVAVIAPQSDNRRLSSPISSDDQAEDDGYDTPPAPQLKRRGRKPGALSRTAREAQRKINHSLIEKARRTKINDALAALRELVPAEYKRVNEAAEASDKDEDDEPKKGKGKSKAGEKEFKLEILVRTVAYLQDLTEKVKRLEGDKCKQCIRQSSDARESKRRKQDVEQEDGTRAEVRSTTSEDPSSRLPSISTWLPHSSQERTRRALTSSQSPSTLRPVPSSSKSPSQQLPTPPTSATFTGSSSVFGVPPILTLPSPSTSLPQSGTQIQPCFSGFAPRRSPSDALSSPVYTPEDETAASLLLRISTSTLVTSPQLALKPGSPSILVTESRTGRPREESVHALTPSRLLGLTAGESEDRL